MLKVRRYLLVLLIFLNVAIAVLASSIDDEIADNSIDEGDENDEDDEEDAFEGLYEDDDNSNDNIKYIYDYYYESQLKSKFQYRNCMDHRDQCHSLRHLCPRPNHNKNDNMNDNDKDFLVNKYSDSDNNELQQNSEHTSTNENSKVVRWMISHCPYTCQVCHTHQVLYNVPYEYSMKYEMEQKVRNLPNDLNLYSKINPSVWVDRIRDAMTGKSNTESTEDDGDTVIGTTSSSDAIGIQYLMSTTTTLHNGVSYEQRNAMIQHIHQTQLYYTNIVVPMTLQNITTQQEGSGIDALPLCRNQSPYCTYWAVVYDRCHDPFYHLVMYKHCPVTCQLCHATPNATTSNNINHDNTKDATTSTVIRKETSEWIVTTTSSSSASSSIRKIMAQNENDMDQDKVTNISPEVVKHESTDVFDSESCSYDPMLMPDVWHPNTNSVNQMFDRITQQYRDSYNIQTSSSSMNMTILSQPQLTKPDEQEAMNDSTSNQQPPWLVQIDNFLSDTECNHLIQLGVTLGYERSTGVEYQPHTTNQLQAEVEPDGSTATSPHLHTVTSDERTSSTTWCHHSDCSDNDVIIQSIYHRIQSLIQIPSSHFESLQLLQYENGQYYKVCCRIAKFQLFSALFL